MSPEGWPGLPPTARTIWCCWLTYPLGLLPSNGTYAAHGTNLATMGLPSVADEVAWLTREWVTGLGRSAVQAHHRQPSRLSDRPEPSGPGLQRSAEPEAEGRHLLRLDPRGLALPRCRRHRPVRPARRRLGDQANGLDKNRIVGSAPGHRRGVLAAGLVHHADRGHYHRLPAELEEDLHRDFDVAKGNRFDNAMVETFFKTLKAELSGAPASGAGLKQPP